LKINNWPNLQTTHKQQFSKAANKHYFITYRIRKFMSPTLPLSNRHYAFVLMAILCLSGTAQAQISIPNTSFTYTENFNTLPISGTGHTAVPAGWAFFETSVAFSGTNTYRAGDVAGAYFLVVYDTYSFGATGDSDRAFGSMPSTNQDSLNSTIGACFTNNTGGTITSMTVTYTGETWRVSSQNRQDGLVFQYNQNTTAINGSGTWTAFTALDYFNPGAPTVGGGSLRHSAVVSATISGLNIAPGNTFCFRWLNFNATAAAQGNPNQEDGIGIDDFSLGNIVVCAPPVISAPTVTQPTCAAPAGGAITVNATGIGTLEYSVNNGSTWSTNPVFSGLAAGNYFIRVRLQANPACETTYGSNPVVLSSPFTASTTSDTWTGCVSTNWAIPGNWADGSVPTAADNATIPNVANDPVITAGTVALAKSVTVQSGAVLTIAATGSLTIDGSATQGILNQGTVENSGILNIGQTTSTGQFGINSSGTFNNNSGGQINIDRSTGTGFFSSGPLNNYGTVTIGANATVGQYGLRASGTFNNHTSGQITADRASTFFFQSLFGTFTNDGTINIGTIASGVFAGFENGATFNNNASGQINIGNGGGAALRNSATFNNVGNITIGTILSGSGQGLYNTGTFNNNTGGQITIDGCTSAGLAQPQSTAIFNNNANITIGATSGVGSHGLTNSNNAIFNNNVSGQIVIDRSTSAGLNVSSSSAFHNFGRITIGATASVGNFGVSNSSIFNNNACATLTSFAPISNASTRTITNSGLFTVNTANASTNAGTFTNNGILEYPQGNPIPNVTNNEIVIAPTTANDCDVISPAFSLGSPVDFTIQGIFTDQAATMSAGTYVTATNTFTPTALLAEGVRTYYVKVMDGSSGCTRIIPWQLTTQNCCDVPQAICKTATIALVGNSASLSVADVNNGSTADCGLQSITVSPNSFNCSHVGTPQTVTLTITDVNGASASCQTTVTIQDNTAPTITCPATQTLVLGANCTATLPNYTSLATTGDNCGVQGVTQSPTAGTPVSGAGNMTVTLTVTDVNGLTNTCTFTVTKVDNTAPSITCPGTQTLTLGANCTATLPNYTTLATTGDNCGVQGVTQSPAAGTPVSGAGNMTVTLTVTDVNGLTNTCTFTVTKVDNTAPSITCPGTQTLTLGANCTATLPNYTSLATTGDNCGVQGVTQSPVAGTTVSSAGNMTVTLTVTDINGNPAQCSFTVTKVDNTPPSISCPTTKTLVLGANCTATLPNYTSLATTGDNCGVQGVTQSPAAGTPVSGAGNMTVTLTVTDVNGLTNTCQFVVTKMDETPPTVVCKNTTVSLNSAGNYMLLAADVFNATASSDNCSGVLTVTNISPATVSCAQIGQTIPVTVTVQDAAGNSATCTAQITVQEGTTQLEGWSSNNVGNANGSGGYKPCTGANGQFTVSATGFSTSSADVLHLISRQLCGNGEIIARVASISGGGWAGVTLRESLAPGSKLVALKTQGANNIRRMIRTTTNGAVNNLNFPRPHTWLRLVRNGSSFTGYTSANGTTWDFAFTATVSMTGCIYAGLFAESINNNVITTATFDNVQIIGGASSLIQAPQTPAAASIFSPEVYPNPTTGAVNIDLSSYANPVGTVKIFDAYGKLVIQNQLDGSALFRMKLDGDDGVYFLSIEVEGEAPVTKRVVIAH